jgi:hypothetical protein
MNNENRYVLRRADGKYLVIASTIDRRGVAMWIDKLESATSWPFMTGATLAKGLDLDPCLHAERCGWEVIPVASTPPTDVVWFSVALPALLMVVLTLLATVAGSPRAPYCTVRLEARRRDGRWPILRCDLRGITPMSGAQTDQ